MWSKNGYRPDLQERLNQKKRAISRFYWYAKPLDDEKLVPSLEPVVHIAARMFNQDDVVLKALHQLRDRGVGIAFDDFGTGYASLSLLKTYPLTRIKLDQSFVQGMLEHEQDASVIRATLDMAHSFHLDAIAEGIEAEAQRKHVVQEQCS